MDRNTITGLVIMSAMLLVYFQFFAPSPVPPEEAANQTSPQTETLDQQESSPTLNQATIATPVEVEDSILNSQLARQYGIFYPGATGENEETVLENEELILKFSSKGGVFKSVELKNFNTYDKNPLILLDENSSDFSILIANLNQTINLKDLYYQSSVSKVGDSTRLSYSLNLGQDRTISHIYTIPESGFEISYKIQSKGLSNFLQNDAQIRWGYNNRHLEKDIKESRIKAAVNYYTFEDEFDGFTERDTDFDEENLGTTKWVAFKQHFFTSAIIADDRFSSAYVSTNVDEANANIVKVNQAQLNIPGADLNNSTIGFKFFFGPNNYEILKGVASDFSKNIYLGWPGVNLVNKLVIIPIFHFLERYIANYGIIIILLVLVIKLVLSPLSYKSYISMAKTKVLKPEMDEIKKNFPDDMQKQQQEQMKLYQQVGVNPLSGCIPLLLQMPILFSLFYFFPSSIELRQEAFLWADDLSSYDSILDLPFTIPLYGDHVSLFTILMTASTILYTWSNNQVSSVQGPMKSITYMMPIIFMFVLNSFPAALSFYYFVANIVTFGQQALIRKFVDEEKIRAILDDNKIRNKDKKKSKFQLKLEEAMKASQEQAKKKQSSKK